MSDPFRPTNDSRFGARPNLTSLRVDGDRYVRWWLDRYGFEAFRIAADFTRDMALQNTDDRRAA